MVRSVSILVPTHNRADLLRQTLASFRSVRIPAGVDVDLIVVANACRDATVGVALDAFPALPMPARCVAEPQPGLSVARNRAVAETAGDICAFVDDDVCVDAAWLEAMVDVYRQKPAGVVGGRVDLWWEAVERPDWLDPDLESLLSRLDHGAQIIELTPPKSIVGANFSFRREVFTTIGPFRTDLGRIGTDLLSTEESEFCDRALKHGFRIFYAPEMRLQHWVAPQRVTTEYLMGVARGFTIGRLRAKPTFGPRQFVRSFFGNIYRVARYEAARRYARLRGNRRLEVSSLVRREGAKAGIQVALRRTLPFWR